MPQPCVIDGCKYTSRVLCHCCNKNLCLEHLKWHDESIDSEINPLVDDINTLTDQLIKLNIEELTDNSREKLNQWRDDCHMMINKYYEKKCQELNQHYIQRIDSLQIEIDQIRSKMMKFICEQNITIDDLETLKLNISDVKRKLIQIKIKPMEIDFHPLIINENLISIEEPKLYELDLLKLSKAYRKFECTDESWPAMANNDRVLLIDQYPNISLLDRDLKTIKQSSWSYGFIRSMCWSSILSSFIVINNEKEIFLIKDNSLSIERISMTEEHYWWSCTCSDTSIFLTNAIMGTNIFEFNLLSSFQLVKRWKPPLSCKKNEYIDDITYNNGTLALIIKVSSNNIVLLELRSSTTLDRIWSLQLGIKRNWFQQTIRCCSIKYDEWLVIEGNTSHIFHILNNGTIKAMGKYKPSPVNAVLFGSNILAIRTKINLFFYRL
ncbi:unnamed protein product [Rotaria sordida]|uniref:Uncharacterized protein n=1 Tax=Rotaria sordida TaxID=392033 RepID=A0A813S485_9BILA|nr:unnamed protein product [Rotaria sordida]CAF0866907.1 unnamed protein product [Rotaria sordida]CAF3553159.1 unnamed protein product [Rotaria sordida]CAF4027351.1 unnamed protein product [Rotaria sordida]